VNYKKNNQYWKELPTIAIPKKNHARLKKCIMDYNNNISDQKLMQAQIMNSIIAQFQTIKLVALVLTVNSYIKVRLDLQADKSPVVVKGPFFPRVVNPRYRIRGTNV
jgi:hypothetical protein